MSVTNKDKQKTSWEKDSLVIVIRGCRGANKHLFATANARFGIVYHEI